MNGLIYNLPPIFRNGIVQLIIFLLLLWALILVGRRLSRYWHRRSTAKKRREALKEIIEYQRLMNEYIENRNLAQKELMEKRIAETMERCAGYESDLQETDMIVGIGGVYGYWTKRLFEEKRGYILALAQALKDGYTGWVAKFVASSGSQRLGEDKKKDSYTGRGGGNSR